MDRLSRLFVVSSIVAASLGSAAFVLAVELPPAYGCGMPEMPITGLAKDRIANAKKDLKDGRLGQAYRVAFSVTELKEATDAEKAAGFAISGWVLWRNGSHDGALTYFKKAKALDSGSIDTVLAFGSDAKVNREIKKAMEA
jgi:hypothetical protein